MTQLLLSAVLVAAVHAAPEPADPGPLPAPSGRYAVGTQELAPVIDRRAADGATPARTRTIQVQVWYPATKRKAKPAPYVASPALIDHLKKEAGAAEAVEAWRSLKTHALQGAPVASGKFPLIVFSQGLGLPRFYYTAWLEELASQGFVVASLDHPEIAPMVVDGKIVEGGAPSNDPLVAARRTEEMAGDVKAVIARLARSSSALHLDGHRVAAVGHALGGVAALEACRTDPGIGGCVDIDGSAWGAVERRGVGRPFLLLLGEPLTRVADGGGSGGAREKAAQSGRQRRMEWRAVLEKQLAPATVVLVKGAAPLSFTDAPFVRPQLLAQSGEKLTDPAQLVRATSRLIAEYLRNAFAKRAGVGKPAEAFLSLASLSEE
jgi:dienelactone hydrolase